MAQEIPVADSGLSTNHIYGRAQLDAWLEEIDLMKAHATSQGTPLPQRTIEKVAVLAKHRIELQELLVDRRPPGRADAEAIAGFVQSVLQLHSELSVLVAPATPRSLAATVQRPWKDRFARPSFIAALLSLALIAIFVFVTTATLAETQPTNKILGQFNWMAAAALGATFSSLFTAYRYIIDRTFDPQYTAVYWVRVILGSVAGVVLANFGKDLTGATATFTPALLALLGGYSAEAVNQVLMRFTEMLVTAVKGSNEAQLREREKELKTLKTQSREAVFQQKALVADELARALEEAKQVSAPDAVITRLSSSLERLRSQSAA
jgi:hypothetical protein